MLDLFNLTNGVGATHEKPRDANEYEIRAYLRWLAVRNGIDPDADNVTLGFNGVSVGKELAVPMPGYGPQPAPTLEIIGDDGEVAHRIILPVNARGQIPMDAAKVKAATGLQAVRAKKAAPVVRVAPVSAAQAIEPPAAPVEALAPVSLSGAPLAVNPEPIADVEAPAGAWDIEAALSEADAWAVAAFAEQGLTECAEDVRAIFKVWTAYVGRVMGCAPDAWERTTGMRQRDRKARNRGRVLIPDAAFEVMRDRFNALLPAAPVAEPIEAAPTAQAVAPIAPDVAALAATIDALLKRVAQLERGAAPKVRTAAQMRGIRAYLALRAMRVQHAALVETTANALADLGKSVGEEKRLRSALAEEQRIAVASEEEAATMRETIAELERDYKTVEHALSKERSAMQPLRDELARLAPIANAIAALTPAPPVLRIVEAA